MDRLGVIIVIGEGKVECAYHDCTESSRRCMVSRGGRHCLVSASADLCKDAESLQSDPHCFNTCNRSAKSSVQVEDKVTTSVADSVSR